MDCDVPEQGIVTRHPSLFIFGHRVSPSRLVPTLQLSELARCGVLSEPFGAGVVPEELFVVAALGARPQSRWRIFSGPARFRQPGQPGGTLAAAEDIASCAEEAMGERSSPARDGSTSQPPHAGPAQAAADSQCPICLGDIKKAAYVAYCMHCFCFACIRRWASRRDACPICRQPLEQLLHSVRGDDDYKEYVVGLPARLRRRMAMERARSRSPQRRYNLRRRPTNNQPSAGRRGPAGTDSAQRRGAAPGPSNATSQQAPAPSASRRPAPPSAAERPAGPAAPPDPHNATVQLRPLSIRLFHLQ
ncbi:uncharacterized protein LJ206_000661 [Theristicus caerulescens]